MHERQERTALQFTSALTLMKRYPVSPEPPLLAKKRRELEEIAERIATFAEVQNVALMAGGKVDGRRRTLREKRMLPLRAIANDELKFAPGVQAALRVPHARASAAVVAAAAIRMADALMPHARLLASAGVSKDFLREMRQEARGLAMATRETADARSRRREATASIASELKKGRAVLSTITGILMLNAPENRMHWETMGRLGKKIGRPRKIRHRKPRPPVS